MSGTKILLTAGSAPGFPSIAESLKPHWILGTDYKDSLAGRQISDRYEITPNLEPLVDASKNEYAEMISELVNAHKIDVVVPLRVVDMLAMSGVPLDIPILAPSSNECVINLLTNKYLLLAQARTLGISVPWFKKTSEFDALSILQKSLPFVMKPLTQSGSRGMRIVRKKIYPFVNDILFKKPAECISINFRQFRKAASVTDMLVMEYLPGVEYTVDCLCHDGKLFAAIPRRRDKVINGISGAGEVVRDENYDEIYKTCKKIIRELKLSYAVGFQFKCNQDGKPRLIECNPRLQGSTCLTVAAGLNIPKLAVRLAFVGKLSDGWSNNFKWGTKFERTFKEWYE